MTETYIGRPVIWAAQAGIVTDQTEGRRGRMLLTIDLGSRTIKADASGVEFTDEQNYAAATHTVTFSRRDRDHYGDVHRMSARW